MLPVVVVAALMIVVAGPTAHAAWLGKARKAGSPALLIASVHRRADEADHFDIRSFTWDTDGTVTLEDDYSPNARAFNDDPAFSPEGGPHIVYMGKSGPNSMDGDLFVVDRQPPGSGLPKPENLTNSAQLSGDAEHPSFSPSGGKIVFDYTKRGQLPQIWITNLAGSLQMPLDCCAGDPSPGIVKGTDPVWSPNSNWIAYTKAVTADINQVWVTSISGDVPLDKGAVSATFPVTPRGDEQPNWSPVGDRIAYINGGVLFVVDFNASGVIGTPTLVDAPPAGSKDADPSWSPDSYTVSDRTTGVIVFERTDSNGNRTLWSVNPNAQNPQANRIDTLDAGFQAGSPDWWPQCTNDRASSDGAVVEGTPGPDLLCGNDGSSTIYGYGGFDHIYAGAGRDRVYAGPGNDFVLGGVGDDPDYVNGGSGDDHLEGSLGNDMFVDTGSKSGRDDIKGLIGNDTIKANDGTKGNDRIDGGDGTDTCYTDNRPGGSPPVADLIFGCEKFPLQATVQTEARQSAHRYWVEWRSS